MSVTLHVSYSFLWITCKTHHGIHCSLGFIVRQTPVSTYSWPVSLSSMTDICESCIIPMISLPYTTLLVLKAKCFLCIVCHPHRAFDYIITIVASKLWKKDIEGKCSFQQSVYMEFFELVTKSLKWNASSVCQQKRHFLFNCCFNSVVHFGQ